MTIPFGSLAVTVDVSTVVATAAHALGETVDDLIGPSCRRPLVLHRHVAMYAARLLGHSYPVIGRMFDRDHTSVISACRRVENVPGLVERAQIIASCSCETEMFATGKSPANSKQRPPSCPQGERRTM